MDSGEEEEEDDDDDEEEEEKRSNSTGGRTERMGKENPSGRYILHTYLHVPTYLGR